MKSVITLISAILLSACGSYALIRGDRIKEEFHQSYVLATHGSVRLHNVNGDVEIKVWDKQEVKVDAMKYAVDEGQMDQLKIEVDASDNLVDIHTRFPENSSTHNGEGPIVDYVLTVPRDANLDEVGTVNGAIEISGTEGNVKASTVNGTVDAAGLKNSCELRSVNGTVRGTFVSLPSDAEIKMASVNGSVTIDLPAGVNASIKANVQNGKIRNDFGLGTSDKHERRPYMKLGDSLKGDIGDGGARIDMSTVNGGIEILKSGKGD